MSNPVEFIQNNKEWLVPIIIAILTALITEGSYIPPDPKPGGYNLCL